MFDALTETGKKMRACASQFVSILPHITTLQPLPPKKVHPILPSSDHIPAQINQTGGDTILYAIHKLVNSVWNKEDLPDHWRSPLLYQLKIAMKL
jgi:hypothetical protein